eukprot:Trichotokara_eunicae@DN2282_c0_g1_i1.p1
MKCERPFWMNSSKQLVWACINKTSRFRSTFADTGKGRVWFNTDPKNLGTAHSQKFLDGIGMPITKEGLFVNLPAIDEKSKKPINPRKIATARVNVPVTVKNLVETVQIHRPDLTRLAMKKINKIMKVQKHMKTAEQESK